MTTETTAYLRLLTTVRNAFPSLAKAKESMIATPLGETENYRIVPVRDAYGWQLYRFIKNHAEPSLDTHIMCYALTEAKRKAAIAEGDILVDQLVGTAGM